MKLSAMLALVLALFTGAAAGSGEALPTPSELEGGRVISVEEGLALYQQGATFIDTRNPLNYGRGHVPGARHIGYQANSEKVVGFDASLDTFDLLALPQDKATVLVFYSHGDTGWKSYKAAVQSISAGYSRVYWMRDGWSGWSSAGYPVEP